MPTKAEQFMQMADRKSVELTKSWQEWAAFLTTASRLYKYPYHEQLMIFAQRPDATACAGYDLWNNRMGRYVRRGSKGIALLDDSGDRPALRYVFDVSDTGEGKNARSPHLWQLEPEHHAVVGTMLRERYRTEAPDLAQQLTQTAQRLADEYWEDHREDIRYIVEDSFLMDYDEYNLGVQFKEAVTVSVSYALMARCALEPEQYFSHEDFMPIFDFNTPATVSALGTAVSQINQEVLRQIEVTIKNHERVQSQPVQAAERTEHDEGIDLQPERRLSDSRPESEQSADRTPGQVWQDAEGLSEGEPAHPLQPAAAEREAVSPLQGDRAGSTQPHGRPAAQDGGPGWSNRASESRQPHGVGGIDEHLQSPDRGNGDGGADQQLTISLFPSEAEQIQMIDEAESRQPSAFSFGQEEIDRMLQLGLNTEYGRETVVMEYLRGKSPEQIVPTLRQIYHDGYGLILEGRPVSAWFGDDGLRLAHGNKAQRVPGAQVIAWEDVAERIGELMQSGQYCTNVELEEAPGHERSSLSQSLWYLWHDLSEEARELHHLSALDDLSGGGFPAETAVLADRLQDPAFRAALIPQLTAFIEAQAQQPDLLRFHYLKLDAMLQHLKDMDLPLAPFQSHLSEPPAVEPFITDDEIDMALIRGTGMENGKQRVRAYWQTDPPRQDKASFLKNEYGTGGRSHALSGAPNSGEDHDAKGITYKKGDCDIVHLNWPQVVNRIDALLDAALYLTAEEQAELADRAASAQLTELALEAQAEEPSEDLTLPQQEYTTTVQEVISGEEHHLPYDVVVETLSFNEPDHYIDHFYVVEDLQAQEPAQSTAYSTLEDAISAYRRLPQDRQKALGVQNTQRPQPERMNLLHCVNGQDVVSEDYTVTDGWNNPEIQEAVTTLRDALASSELPPIAPVNFHITDEHLGEGGAKAKFQANMAAITLLQELQAASRNATPAEQEILSRYVGWGGLADAFDPNQSSWSKEYAQLKDALSPADYEAVRASTLNAHYTSPTVIQAIYEAVGKLGFEAGNILEPSCGVGNFFGLLPDTMRNSRLYGVELDPVSGHIAQKLYPKAEITVAGFETTDRRDFFDLAVGNVPFGQYQVNDRAYNKLNFSIHNYFFAKALDQVRPGGIVAFVTSRYTMDAKDSTVRRYLAQRAELLGAIRLPNNAFKKNAGAEVVSDILFLQKRDRPLDIAPEWTQTGVNRDGCAVNQYFLSNPQMVLGTPTMESTAHGMDYTVAPIEGADLAQQLHTAVGQINGSYLEAELPDLGDGAAIDTSIPADPQVKNFSYTIVDGKMYYRENSRMVRPDLTSAAQERIKGMVELRDCVNQLIDLQLDPAVQDESIHRQQAQLNRLYDSFSARYGLINDRVNQRAFSDDSSYYLLCALEVLDEDQHLERKADMFTKRTIKPHEAVTSVDTASEALAVSISERACVDMAYMSQLTGKSAEALAQDLRGVIFRVPEQGGGAPSYVPADEYLSGNVRRKLRIAQRAAANDPTYAPNVEALLAAQPKDLDASEIEVRLGATWIDKRYIEQFMYETFDTPFYQQRTIRVNYSPFTAEWQITGKSSLSHNDIAAYTTYGTDRANAYKILEESLNLRDVRIYDTIEDVDGKERRVLNARATTLAAQKQQSIRDAFQDWIWRDPQRRQDLVRQYNEEMNSTRPREYDGSHIVFGGINPEITLREHQKNAIAHVLYGGNTLLAHEVGAGKTFEMVAAAMEAKRLGLCTKSLFAVPNHLTEQWASEFLRLYPSANILVTTKKDFEPQNRKKFCARIATGDYDAIIMGHSQFEKIPISRERQERLLQEQIQEITDGIEEVQSSGGERFTVKQLERTRKSLETRLAKLEAQERKDDVVTFEQLGVDRLFVDEAHNYKNLFLFTKMRNVAGLATTDAQKSSDMFAKCRYMDEITGSKGVIFATGTPVSNSMTELYTMQRYLQFERLRELNMVHFDCWASRFGETMTALELAPEGTGYRARTRFSKFFNLPELMNIFREVADIKTADQLHLPTPEVEYHNIVAKPTETQQEMVKALSERAAKIHSGAVDPSEDNMLKITSDGRKLGLDQRIINSLLPDEAGTKVNQCVDNILQLWKDGESEKLTQLVFCDISTPKGAPARESLNSPEPHGPEEDAAPEAPAFTVYEDIRQKLISQGVPEKEIAFIHEANTEVKKKELFGKVRSGQVRVLLGSTSKMGAGTNVQDRLVALHDLDCPWRPGDLAQRKGRIERQGNQNEKVHVFRYVTEGTFDAYLWQTVENKQKFISQIMTSKSPVRTCEDVDETALSFAEIKALCAGDPRIKERMDLDVEVSRLKLMKADHQSKQFRLEDQLLKVFPQQIEEDKAFIKGLEADMETLSKHPLPTEGFVGMNIKGTAFTKKEDAGAALLDICKDHKSKEPVAIGTYRGFAMSVSFDAFQQQVNLQLKGEMTHRATLGTDPRGNIVRMDNALAAMPERLKAVKARLDNLCKQQEAARLEAGKPFPQEEELKQKTARLVELDSELNIDGKGQPQEVMEKTCRPSLMAQLRRPLPQRSSDRKPKPHNMEER